MTPLDRLVTDIKAFFAEGSHNYFPVRSQFYTGVLSNGTCGICALSAAALSLNPTFPVERLGCSEMFNELVARYEISLMDLMFFWKGFDNVQTEMSQEIYWIAGNQLARDLGLL